MINKKGRNFLKKSGKKRIRAHPDFLNSMTANTGMKESPSKTSANPVTCAHSG